MTSASKTLKQNAFRALNWRSARLLGLMFALSFVNLAGAFLALSVLGGIDPWSDAQFVGLFGLIEAGFGLGFIFAPNAWRLPVAESNTSDRTTIRLAASTLLIPHWMALAKAAGGFAMMAYAAAETGVSPGTIGVAIECALIAMTFVAVTIAVARIGVAWPQVDVFFISIRRPGHDTHELPGIAASGVLIQLLSNVGIYPAVQLLRPGILYHPELAPSAPMLGLTAAVAGASVLIAASAWWGRIVWAAPRAQQQEAEGELAKSN